MTKARARKLIKEEFCSAKSKFWIGPLCIKMPDELKYDWKKYWNRINTDRVDTIADAFDFSEDAEVIVMARLLIAHNFIEDTY